MRGKRIRRKGRGKRERLIYWIYGFVWDAMGCICLEGFGRDEKRSEVRKNGDGKGEICSYEVLERVSTIGCLVPSLNFALLFLLLMHFDTRHSLDGPAGDSQPRHLDSRKVHPPFWRLPLRAPIHQSWRTQSVRLGHHLSRLETVIRESQTRTLRDQTLTRAKTKARLRLRFTFESMAFLLESCPAIQLGEWNMVGTPATTHTLRFIGPGIPTWTTKAAALAKSHLLWSMRDSGP